MSRFCLKFATGDARSVWYKNLLVSVVLTSARQRLQLVLIRCNARFWSHLNFFRCSCSQTLFKDHMRKKLVSLSFPRPSLYSCDDFFKFYVAKLSKVLFYNLKFIVAKFFNQKKPRIIKRNQKGLLKFHLNYPFMSMLFELVWLMLGLIFTALLYYDPRRLISAGDKLHRSKQEKVHNASVAF